MSPYSIKIMCNSLILSAYVNLYNIIHNYRLSSKIEELLKKTKLNINQEESTTLALLFYKYRTLSSVT